MKDFNGEFEIIQDIHTPSLVLQGASSPLSSLPNREHACDDVSIFSARSDVSLPFVLTFSQVLAFLNTLQENGVTASVRQTRGMEANAACGQLRNDFQKVPLAAA